MLSFLLICILIGVLSTLIMTSFLWVITHFGICHVDMVKAIGAWYVQDEKNAFVPGLISHFTTGSLFSFVYILLFKIIPNVDEVAYVFTGFGAGLGFVHGLVVALMLVTVIAENHPVKKYQKASFEVGFYHFVGHILYGITAGTLYGLLLH